MHHGLNVLIVEDSEIVRPITIEYLIELGHRATGVASAEEALSALEVGVYDALLTDVRLPGMSGVALAKHCAVHMPLLSIVVTSGYGDLSAELFSPDLRQRIYMLPKPFDLAAMEKVLNAIAAK
jgi:DNA-binding NtrC family response regulator